MPGPSASPTQALLGKRHGRKTCRDGSHLGWAATSVRRTTSVVHNCHYPPGRCCGTPQASAPGGSPQRSPQAGVRTGRAQRSRSRNHATSRNLQHPATQAALAVSPQTPDGSSVPAAVGGAVTRSKALGMQQASTLLAATTSPSWVCSGAFRSGWGRTSTLRSRPICGRQLGTCLPGIGTWWHCAVRHNEKKTPCTELLEARAGRREACVGDA